MIERFFRLTTCTVLVALLSACATTNSQQFSCDFFDGVDNNFEVKDGRDDRYGSNHSDGDNLVADSVIGLFNALFRASSRAISSQESADEEKCGANSLTSIQ